MEQTKPHPTIVMHPVQSSQIAAIGHDAATNTLAVKFHGSGATYHYDNVGPDTFEAFKKAESIGKFFGAHVKGKYGFKKLEKPAPVKAEGRR